MMNLTIVGRAFFAIALIGLGIEHFLFRAFVTGPAPPWPASLPGGEVWAYLTGIAFIGVGAAVLVGKRGRLAAVFAGSLILVWAVLRYIPVIAGDSFLGGRWTVAGQALTFFGGSWAIAATLPKEMAGRDTRLSRFLNLKGEFVLLGRICLGIYLVNSGIQHFMFAEGVASMIPGWFPGDAAFWTYFAGVALISGGIGLIIPRTARLAALLAGSMIFSWVWVVHLPGSLASVSAELSLVEALISVFGALAVSGIAFAIAGYMGDEQRRRGGERIRTAEELTDTAATAGR